jgi:hypothetical protein
MAMIHHAFHDTVSVQLSRSSMLTLPYLFGVTPSGYQNWNQLVRH